MVIGSDKWILYNIIWNGRDHGASEMSHHKPPKASDVVYMVVSEGSALIYELLLENQTKQLIPSAAPNRSTESST